MNYQVVILKEFLFYDVSLKIFHLFINLENDAINPHDWG